MDKNIFVANDEPQHEKKIEVKVTMLSEILSFSKPIVTPCTNIITLDTNIQLPDLIIHSKNTSNMMLLVKIIMFDNNEILVMGKHKSIKLNLQEK